jgi:hypothetical protein
MEGAGQTEFHRQAVGRLRQAFAIFPFGFVGVAASEQRVREVQPQR